MSVTLQFLGAAGTVTGSKYLLTTKSGKVLIDAGIFQGERAWNERNWQDFPVPPAEVRAVVLTHAHIDHTGMLPRLVRQGLNCPVFATPTTISLSALLLPDSAHLQEEDAAYFAKKKASRHDLPLPLYTMADAAAAVALLRPVQWLTRTEVISGVFVTWHRAGHILGAASLTVEADGEVVTFSGDIGRYDVPILKDPEPPRLGNLLLIESTYGDRNHSTENSTARLGEIISSTAKRSGVVVIPSFAVGRCQHLLYEIRELKSRKLIPDIPIIVDSPMASDATALYRGAIGEYDDAALGIISGGGHPFSTSKLGFVKDRDESIKLNSIDQPMVIISASGMLSGGRVLHHIRNRISDPRNTILFIGHQPKGGRGDYILSGAPTIRLFKEECPIRAHIESIGALSAHADQTGLLRWMKEALNKGNRPDKVAVVHGEQATREIFAPILAKQFGVSTIMPQYCQTLSL